MLFRIEWGQYASADLECFYWESIAVLVPLPDLFTSSTGSLKSPIGLNRNTFLNLTPGIEEFAPEKVNFKFGLVFKARHTASSQTYSYVNMIN